MQTPFVSFSVLVVAFCTAGAAQSKKDLIGTWKLISTVSVRPNGDRVPLYGQHPVGLLTYTRDGRMNVVIADADRKPLSGEDRRSTTATERAEAFSTFQAYAGRYTFEGNRVVHHIEIALFQNWVKTDQIRFITLAAHRLTLRTPPRTLSAEQRVQELVWEKLK